MTEYEKCKKEVQQRINQSFDLTREVTDEEVQDLIDDALMDISREYTLSLRERQSIAKEIFDAMRRLDILQELIDDDEITEIMINGCENIFLEKKGNITRWNKQFESKEKLDDVIQQIVGSCNRSVNEASPIVDARLANGARVNIVLNGVALDGPIVTIRKFPSKQITIDDLIGYGSITREAASFLEKLVLAGYNILISGGTGSGKTTFLNVLSHYIPKHERVITIEDSAELQLQDIPNLVRMETRSSTQEGVKEIPIRELIRASLRMRPDRLVVGEVRGEEAIDMLQALNTGHDGSLSTAHANSTLDMISRLETMVLMGMEIPIIAVRKQIASGIDIIVHLGRMRDKSRKVLEIAELDGIENGEVKMNILYKYENGQLVKQKELKNKRKLYMYGMEYEYEEDNE